MDDRVISMAVLVACGVNGQGQREVLAVEPMLDESKESYAQLFQSLKQRGLDTPSLVVSDANKGLLCRTAKGDLAGSFRRVGPPAGRAALGWNG